MRATDDSRPAKQPRLAASAAPRVGNAPGVTSARGTIARVKLHNFMSYRDAEIGDPGSQLNCIVGPNGTGKSSIVCAMCVGLGGPLKLTERGDQIKACVHGEGQHKDEYGQLITSGFVETELVDGIAEGRNLVVRLDFDVDNKKKWTMNGVSTTEKKVKEKMEELNIQVDNPLQFLPQDKVGQFSNMSPVELLKHTEMAIGPEVHRQHLDLIELDKEVVTVEQRLTTERKKLEDLERINKALEQDVERFKRLQENKRRLDGFRGKKLWAEAGYLEDREKKLKGELAEKKREFKDLQARLKAKQADMAPLDDAKKLMEAKVKEANGRALKADAEIMKLGKEFERGMDAKETTESEIDKLDRHLEKLREKRKERETQHAQLEAELERKRQQLQQSSAEDPEAQHAQLKAALDEATRDTKRAQDELRAHETRTNELLNETQRTQQALHELQDVGRRKMQKVAKGNKDAAQLSQWIQQVEEGGVVGPRDVISTSSAVGPLLMLVDVPRREHQPLVEEAIGPKLAYSLLALTSAAQTALNKKVADESWNVAVYRYGGSTFQPTNRPSSQDMARFGVTAWLDEAIEVAPEHREKILGALKDLTGIDKFLLGTMQTATKIEELQRYLAEQQMDGVTICTPERTYKVTRSRYGQRQHLNTTSNPKAKVDLFAIAAKPQELEKAQQDFRDAKRASDDHLEGKERLQERVHQANEFRKARQQELATFNDGFAGVAAIEKRLPASLQRVEQARKEEAAFDVGARRSELQAKLVQMAKGEAQLTTRVAKQQVALTKASSDEYGARLAMRVAMQQMADVKEAQDEMNKEVRVTQDEVERLKEQFAAAVHDAKKKRDEARRAAPQFEMDPTTMLRGTEATQREWDAMPNELDALDAEIESLEEDIASSDDDDGKTLRDYEERCKQIEAMKDTVAGTRGEIDAKRDRLAAQVAQWKPQLEQMVAVVDDNFAAYFRRFKCVGRVELVDGRKRSPVTGEAEGIDDFAQYKIHIKVQWRENESLHVLGEGGRDSGGERSVATMVYLISLQSVNPAPFRVVDEINQAMDSTNERHVFECITHACREGGKQYFLLTPKLLPDLDYGEETAIQLVLNGPYAVNRSAFTLAKYC